MYECKRLLGNRFFVGLMLVLLIYGWQVFNHVTILGVSHTAPFSPWSFGHYLSRMIPVLWIGALSFLTFFTSSKAQRVAVLTDATQISPTRYTLVRYSASLVGTALLALACLVEAAALYFYYFCWYEWETLLPPALIVLIPPLIFSLGIGWHLGQVKPELIYGWMLAPFVCMAIPFPDVLGIWSGNFFTHYPLTLGSLDPPFTVPVAACLAQCALLIIGVAVLMKQTLKKHKVQ